MISSRMDDQAPKQSLRIDSNMPFSAIDLFEGVEAADSSHSGAWNRLAVDNQRAGSPVATRSAPDCAGGNAQNAQDTSFLAPSAKVVVHGLPLGKLAGQHAPLRSCFDHVQDCIQHVVAKGVAAFATGGEIAADLFPLGVRQVGAIALLAHGFGESFSEEIVDSFRKRGGLPSVFGYDC